MIFIDIDFALEIMADHDYRDDQLATIRKWHEGGRRVLIFENHDLGHPELGHVMAMPWDADEHEQIPPHGPDHPSVGFGWRYITAYVVEPNTEEEGS